MVYSVLNGRLGNNLFQIAAGASLAKKNNTDFIAVCQDGFYLSDSDHCFVSEYVKQFQDNIFQNINIELSKPGDYFHYIEPEYTYDEIPYHDNIRTKGWFQSEKYFDKELVRELFQIPFEIKEYIDSKYGHLFKEKINSLHIRRGDYLKQPHLFSICSLDYYKRGINLIGKNERYLVISDDIEWCKNHFKGDNFNFVDKESAIVDLYLQSCCENNIISNSTFSWWGAWLNPNPNKKVVCPTPWFGKEYKHKSDKDLIPDSWIRIKNKPDLKYKLLGSYLYNKNRLEIISKKITPNFIKNLIKKI